MSEQWTPGPWEYDGKFTVSIPVRHTAPVQLEYPFRIATPADARLIALAPEMVEFIALMVQGWDAAATVGLKLEGNVTAATARDLLARARGEDVPAPVSPF